MVEMSSCSSAAFPDAEVNMDQMHGERRGIVVESC